MTKPHHVRRALLIAPTIVAALVAGCMVYLTSCAAAEQTAQTVSAILPTLLGTPSAVSACAQLEKTTGKEGNC